MMLLICQFMLHVLQMPSFMSILSVFERYDPNFMAASLDEAYLDITKVCQQRGTTGGEVCLHIKNKHC